MHANLNKTASKTLLPLLPKDEEGKARKPRTFLHNLLKIRGAQTMAAVRNARGRWELGQGARRAAKLHEMCFYFAVHSAHCSSPPPLPPCGTDACLLAQGIILWLVCIYFSFAWIFHCFPRRKAQTERTALHAPQDQHKHAIFVSGKSARKSTCNTDKSSAPLPLSQGSSQCLQCYPLA